MPSQPCLSPLLGHNSVHGQYLEQFVSAVRDRYPAVFDEVHSLITSPRQTLQIEFFDQHQTLAKATRRPPKISGWAQRLVNKIPRTENEWQKARRILGIENEENILSCLSRFRACGYDPEHGSPDGYSIFALADRVLSFTQEPSNSPGSVALTSFLFIITCHFDKSMASTDVEVTSALEAFLVKQNVKSKKSSKRYITGALKVAALIDRLYGKLQHRAFELLMHFFKPLNDTMPYTNLCNITENDLSHIESQVEIWKPVSEIQASAPFCIVHLLQLWRPTCNLAQIGESLKTALHYTTGPNVLLQALEKQSLSPCLKRKRDESDWCGDKRASYWSEDPTLCSDAGIVKPSRLGDPKSTPHVYAAVEMLPSQNVGLEEVDDDWVNAFAVGNISTNGQPEHSLY
ncbi:uncharacterized protein FTOL_02105 [Fusarium torulosum]|uniref:Uncharacterized protein n=1 Tax=Fusarium torulosum TaxID=33205 RepID=A0AAE8SEA2_9HYPO|nr:uncharacterized protein FTOL_02105 [Fusarium torulosum]